VANSTVTLTTTWQRFAITGQTTLSQLSFYVGGAVTFVSGDAILIWGAQIDRCLVLPDVLQTEPVGWTVKMPGEVLDRANVGMNGARSVVATLQLFQHDLT
jgi:hypothetical protein